MYRNLEKIHDNNENYYLTKIKNKKIAQPINDGDFIEKIKDRYLCKKGNFILEYKINSLYITNSRDDYINKNIFFSGIDSEIYVIFDIEVKKFSDKLVTIFGVLNKDNYIIDYSFSKAIIVGENIMGYLKFKLNTISFNGNYYVDFYILGKLIFRKEIIFKNNSIYTNKIRKGAYL